jgi:hypothetical protein
MRKRVIAAIFVAALLIASTAQGQWVRVFKAGSHTHQAQ